MSNKLKRIIAILMTIVMVIGVAQLTPVLADENSGGKITHNVTGKQIPYIYCYTNEGTIKLDGYDKDIPKGTYSMNVYIKSTNLVMDTINSKVTINGEEITVRWSTANNGYYTCATFETNSNSFNDVNIEIKCSGKRNFSIRARKIIPNNFLSASEMEQILNNNPATYRLFNEDGTVSFNGTINTGVDAYTNFVHWEQVKGQEQYITDDNTHIRNLPNGHYTLTETDSGKGLKTEDKTSSSAWLDSSVMKDNNGKKYYTFTITDETVSQWMDACIYDGEGGSLFYGFYLEDFKTTFNMTYDGNGYNQGIMKNHANVKANETFKLNDNQYIRYGYTFTGWNTVANPTQDNPGFTYANQSEMTIKEDTVLYAQWKKNIGIAHNVYIQDNSKEIDKIKEVDNKKSSDLKFIYSKEALNEILLKNMSNGYKWIETIVEVKKVNSDIWETYQPNTNIEDESQVRYVLVIDKDLQVTKTLSYNIEHYIEGEDRPRDIQTISSEVWINDLTTDLDVKDIVLNNYDNYEFSHYDPTDLPKTIEDKSVIKVYYREVQVPVLPVEPGNPDIPVIPEIPNIIVVPTVPTTPIVPILPTIPTVNNVVRNPIVALEENQIPTDNGATENIEDAKVPLDQGISLNKSAWALVNLICVFVTIGIGLLAVALSHRKDEDEKSQAFEDESIYVRRRWTKFLSMIVAVISIIVFVITENILLPMIFIDQWTTLMVIIVLVQILVYIASRHYKNERVKKIEYNQ